MIFLVQILVQSLNYKKILISRENLAADVIPNTDTGSASEP